MILYTLRRYCSKKVFDRSVRIQSRVMDVRIGTFRMSGLILSSKQDFMYNPWISKDGYFYCDCQGYETSETLCSHIVAMFRRGIEDGKDVSPWVRGLQGLYNEDQDMRYKTSVEGYNQLFGGLRANRRISSIAAPPETGKSYLIATFACDMAKHGFNSLIIDTEGGFEGDWIEAIAEKMGMEIDIEFIDWTVDVLSPGDVITPNYDYSKFKFKTSDTPTVYIYECRHLAQLLPFFGRPLKFKIKGGVIEPIEGGGMTSIEDSPIGKLVVGANIGMVALDSISSPVENLFTGGQINYRTRAKATQAVLGRAQDLVDAHQIVFMNSAHATIQHNNPHAKPSIVGGKAVLHNIKYIAYMDKYGGKKVAKTAGVDYLNLRKLAIFRHPMKTPWRDSAYVMTTAAGVVDFNRRAVLDGGSWEDPITDPDVLVDDDE